MHGAPEDLAAGVHSEAAYDGGTAGADAGWLLAWAVERETSKSWLLVRSATVGGGAGRLLRSVSLQVAGGAKSTDCT